MKNKYEPSLYDLHLFYNLQFIRKRIKEQNEYIDSLDTRQLDFNRWSELYLSALIVKSFFMQLEAIHTRK